MDENAQGIILRLYPLTETSLIVHWLTPKFGRLATIAKGARRPKSAFLGKLDLFHLADFSFARSRRSALHTLREVSLKDPHEFLRRDYTGLRQAAYAGALIQQATEEDTPLHAVFEILIGFLNALRQTGPPLHLLLAFELKLLAELGLQPDPSQTRLNAGDREILRVLAEKDWGGVARLKLSAAQFTEVRQFLHGFLIYHLGKLPKGREAALTNS